MNLTPQFSLRFLDIKPSDFPMEQLGEFVCLFAELLGFENKPKLVSIQNKSTALEASVHEDRRAQTVFKLQAANNPSNKEHKTLASIEKKMRGFGLLAAELIDLRSNQIIYTIQPENDEVFHTVFQEGEVEGEITGVEGADDTMHISIREWNGRILHLPCTDVQLALEIAKYLRNGAVRLFLDGLWERTNKGWKPSNKKCFVENYEVIQNISIDTLMNRIREIPGNGWKTFEDVEPIWQELRGLSA